MTPSINLPAPGRHHTLYVHFRVCRVLCFNKQLQPAGIFDRFNLRPLGTTIYAGAPSPEVTVLFCLVPSPEFSQAPEYSLPDHLCRFSVRFSKAFRLVAFPEVWYQLLQLRRASSSSLCVKEVRFAFKLPYLPTNAHIQQCDNLTYSVPTSQLYQVQEY